jgi:hypothetical protein
VRTSRAALDSRRRRLSEMVVGVIAASAVPPILLVLLVMLGGSENDGLPTSAGLPIRPTDLARGPAPRQRRSRVPPDETLRREDHDRAGHPRPRGGIVRRQKGEVVIARIWRGVVRTDDAADYVRYVRRTGIEHYRSTPGNIGAWILHRSGSCRDRDRHVVPLGEHGFGA